ncbi:NADPH-dependent FMN reductase [Mucilaginibacter arboris]|uniref:NADPH-dependent FMN reductase n=1 Tax=Mucilaginibacter arboris TaxID=2682090 RepID=A0A7K1SXR5_9SPHI|nr:NAD(P)H-dependent oxidoreductase [Mucilaginibacter arboris]MVN22106.1 NADPH-dependent FMN reductase [Mucilaginibacter arboris]
MLTIIAGTNRPGSSTLKLAVYYQKKLNEKGVEAKVLSLEELPDNLLKTDLYGKRSEGFKPLQKLVNASEKFIFIIPEYNGSFPGVLKAFVDACDFPGSFYDKKAALVGISSGKYGNIRGVDHFTGVCNYVNMHVLSLKLHIPFIRKEIDTNGNLTETDTIGFTNEQMDRFIKF